MYLEDPIFRDTLRKRFEEEGWDVEEAAHEEDVARRAVQFLPHVVLAECANVENGKAMLSAWKRLPTLKNAVVVLYMSAFSHEDAHALLQAGAATVLLRGHHRAKEIVRRVGWELP